MADHTDYSSTSSDTAATDSDASEHTRSRNSNRRTALANGNTAHKQRATKPHSDAANSVDRKKRTAGTTDTKPTKRTRRTAKAPSRPRQRVQAAAGNGKKLSRVRRRRSYDDEYEDDEVVDDEYLAMADDVMDADDKAGVQRQRERMDDGDEMMEADSEEGLASLITRSSSLSSPSMLLRERYLAIVVEDLQQLLLPPTATHTATTAASAYVSDLSLLSQPKRRPFALLSPSASTSAFRTFAFPPSIPYAPPESSAVESALQHALLSRPFRLHCQYQLFASSIDAPYLHYDEFADCYRERVASQSQFRDTLPAPLPVDSIVLNFFDTASPSHLPLSHPVCRALRRSLGRPRRFSRAFIAEERVKLAEYRNYVRVNQRGTQSLHPPPFVPTALQLQRPRGRLVQGQQVVCIHPQTGELHDGVVVGYGQDRADRISNGLFHYYRVKFKQIELGSALVEDISVMVSQRGVDTTPPSAVIFRCD